MEPIAGDPQSEAAAIAGEGEEGGGLDSVAVAAPIAGGDDASAMAAAEVEEASIAEGDEKDGEIDAPAAATQISGGDEKGGEFDASAMAAAEVEVEEASIAEGDEKDGEIDAPAAATQISGGDEKGGEFDASAMAAAEVEEAEVEEALIAEGDEKDGEIDAPAAATQISGGDEKGGEFDASAMAAAEVEEASIAEGDEKDGEIDALAEATQISGGDEKGGEFDASAMAAAEAEAEVEEALIAVTDRDKKGEGLKTNAGIMGAAPPPQLPLLPRPLPSYKDVVEMLRLISTIGPTVGSRKSIIPSFGDKESLLEFAPNHPSCEVIVKEHIKKLGKNYRFFRRTNLVGSSLFRCFMIAYLEHILMTGDSQEAYHMLLCIENCKYRHMNLGGSKFEFDDFAREFSQLVTCVSKKEKHISEKELVEKCRDECFSRSIIVFLKLVACAVACEMWEAAPGYQNAAEFCLNEIVPTNCEGMESKIINLVVEALRVPIRVFMLTNTRLLHQGPQDYLPPNVGPPRPFLTFMVRTGRCEVLYS